MLRGVFAGEGGPHAAGGDAFPAAVALSAEVNVETVASPFARRVAYPDADEHRSTWLGNKAIYRTRLAMAGGGELVVVAPGVERFRSARQRRRHALARPLRRGRLQPQQRAQR